MKKFLMLMMLLCSIGTWAQDVIVKKDGTTVVCRVVEVTDTEVVYKKWSDLKGANYIIDKSFVSAINYESGKKETTSSEAENLYKPSIQNDGTQALNDKALLGLDMAASKVDRKVKRLKRVGWIGGGVCMAAGVALITIGCDGQIFDDVYHGGIEMAVGAPGIILFAGGAALMTGCLIKANKIQKQLSPYSVNSAPLYQKQYRLKNGSSLATGVNFLGDNTNRHPALGIGLNYSF